MTERQLLLDLPPRDATGRSDFLPGQSNAAALAALDRWPDWPGNALMIVGPGGAGRSHLARIWQDRSGARLLTGRNVTAALPEVLATTTPVALDDADNIAGSATAEEALFHLINHLRQAGASLLLTARETPGAWRLMLPDLESRLLAIPPVHVAHPDDGLVYMVLAKLCDDRQMMVGPEVLDYLVARIDRSLSVARRVVARLDELALTFHRRPTRALAAEALASFTADPTAV
ncbi:MAG: hypothetical protein ACK5IB_14055 [Qingshengfaniella sp.]